jgi:hypothetical protein
MKSIAGFVKVLSVIILLCYTTVAQATRPLKHYYQIKIYHFKTKAQEDRLDKYLKDAYVPAMKRMTGGGWIGVFKTMDTDTDRRIYVFTVYAKQQLIAKEEAALLKDKKYLADAKDYFDASYDATAYTRFETITLLAFDQWRIPMMPNLSAAKKDRVYELRSYESPTEKYNLNKVKMFNEGGEVTLFSRLNFNAIFYANVISGSHMPNLMYMTTFNSKEDRDKHWDAFFGSPEWKVLIADPQYAHNVSKADILFLHPTEYSDF